MKANPVKCIDVYSLEPQPNVCNQVLREVLSAGKFSLAHVTMAAGQSSLYHAHAKLREFYFVLEGNGVLLSRFHWCLSGLARRTC